MNHRSHPLWKKLWAAHSAMISRCTQKNHPQFNNYGGRGIKVCERWIKSLDNFIEDMGWPANPKLTLERINNDGNYEKDNCRWATQREQMQNTRRVKISKEIAQKIRSEANLTNRTLAKKYGISLSRVSNILTGDAWR